ncbi:MAG: WD40/YVTN/BNR-like repeat-containing protein [Ignavibacteriaceae bacterium]
MKRMRKIFIVIAVIMTAFLFNACEIISFPDKLPTELPLFLSKKFPFTDTLTSRTGSWDFESDQTYKDLKKKLENNMEVWGISLRTVSDNASDKDTWTPQQSPSSLSLNSVYFTDANTGWAVGHEGIIIKTTTGGKEWIAQAGGGNNPLVSVYFVNNNIGWAVGQTGTIIKTSNGGQTWTPQNSQTIQNLYDVFFINANTGWIVGFGTILKTNDGGTTWTPQVTGSYDWYRALYFTDANTGWVIGSPGIIKKTTNGGATWTQQTSGTINAFSNVQFIDANTGWIVGVSEILKTTNGGLNWFSQSQSIGGIEQKQFFGVSFTDAYSGWVAGSDGIIKTKDGGVSWTSQAEGIFMSVYFTDASNGTAVGFFGNISRFSEAGKYDIDLTFKDATDPTKTLFTLSLKDKRISDWITKPLFYGLSTQERNTLSEYLINNKSVNYEIKSSKKDSKFDFELEMYLTLITKLNITK